MQPANANVMNAAVKIASAFFILPPIPPQSGGKNRQEKSMFTLKMAASMADKSIFSVRENAFSRYYPFFSQGIAPSGNNGISASPDYPACAGL